MGQVAYPIDPRRMQGRRQPPTTVRVHATPYHPRRHHKRARRHRPCSWPINTVDRWEAQEESGRGEPSRQPGSPDRKEQRGAEPGQRRTGDEFHTAVNMTHANLNCSCAPKRHTRRPRNCQSRHRIRDRMAGGAHRGQAPFRRHQRCVGDGGGGRDRTRTASRRPRADGRRRKRRRQPISARPTRQPATRRRPVTAGSGFSVSSSGRNDELWTSALLSAAHADGT